MGMEQSTASNTWRPIPFSAYEDTCRICSTPLPAFHDRLVKYCGQHECPSSVGALGWQCA